MYVTPGNDGGLRYGHCYLALHRSINGAGWAPFRVLDLGTASDYLLHALLITKACAAALALHRSINGAGWAPFRVLDLGTASDYLLQLTG